MDGVGGAIATTALVAFVTGAGLGYVFGVLDGRIEGRDRLGAEMCAKQGARWLDGKCMLVKEVEEVK